MKVVGIGKSRGTNKITSKCKVKVQGKGKGKGKGEGGRKGTIR